MTRSSAFATPSGNIVCEIVVDDGQVREAVRCDLVRATFPLPPKPAGCPVDWGPIGLGDRAHVVCAGDTVVYMARLGFDETAWYRKGADGIVRVQGVGSGGTVKLQEDWSAVLGYGSKMIAGSISCAVERKGVTCRNARTGAQFTVSKEHYSISN